MPDIKSLAYSRNVDMVNTFTKSLTKLTMMLSACEPIKAAPSETLHQKKITGKLTAEEYGIIPAYAGSTRHGQRYSSQGWDHPRVCGEHNSMSYPLPPKPGSSPRMRGARGSADESGVGHGIIPAYAGSTLKNPSSESRNPIIELHFNQFAKKVKRCFAIRFRPMRYFVVKVQ